MIDFGKECTAVKDRRPRQGISMNTYITEISKEIHTRQEDILFMFLEQYKKQKYMSVNGVIDYLYDEMISWLFGFLPRKEENMEIYSIVDSFLHRSHYPTGTVYPFPIVEGVVRKSFDNMKLASCDNEVRAFYTCVKLKLVSTIENVFRNKPAGYHKVRFTVKQIIFEILCELCDKDIQEYAVLVNTSQTVVPKKNTKPHLSYDPMSLKGVCYQTDTRDRKFLRELDNYQGQEYDDLYDLIWIAREQGTNPLLTEGQVAILEYIGNLPSKTSTGMD